VLFLFCLFGWLRTPDTPIGYFARHSYFADFTHLIYQHRQITQSGGKDSFPPHKIDKKLIIAFFAI
jgi:hypothetical protein